VQVKSHQAAWKTMLAEKNDMDMNRAEVTVAAQQCELKQWQLDCRESAEGEESRWRRQHREKLNAH
jgi:hypothetical protein